jgi:hypothetical protein
MVEIDLVENVTTAIELFTEVALQDPLSGVLLAFGTLFVGVSVAVFGGLSVGGAFSFVGRLAEGSDPRE